jgi:hypothetical protein
VGAVLEVPTLGMHAMVLGSKVEIGKDQYFREVVRAMKRRRHV